VGHQSYFAVGGCCSTAHHNNKKGSIVGHSIVKFGEQYLMWSSVADAPTTNLMTLPELKEHILQTEGYEGLSGLPRRLNRVEQRGTSSLTGGTLKSLLAHNRAGPDESRLATEAQFIEHYTASPSEADAPLDIDISKPIAVMNYLADEPVMVVTEVLAVRGDHAFVVAKVVGDDLSTTLQLDLANARVCNVGFTHTYLENVEPDQTEV
jgi:hypothetical protein